MSMPQEEEDNQPMLEKKDELMDNLSQEDDGDDPGCTAKYEGVPCNGDQFIFSYESLVDQNKNKETKDETEIILRNMDDPEFQQPFGIRAHPEMNWVMCLWSTLVPWHNEFLTIWLYLGFSIYFWVELFMIMGKHHAYQFKYGHDFDLMFIATLGFALSLTCTAVFLIFYSVSKRVYEILEKIDYMGKLILVFFYTFAFIGSELVGSSLYFAFMFVVLVILIANLILVQYSIGRIISFWMSVTVLTIVYVYDFIFFSSPKQKEVFYIPIFVELAILLIGYLLYVYMVPERFCRDTKFVQLYITGFIFFTLFLINFYFEAHNILYYTLKLNSGNYDDEADDWWHTDNIYHK